MPTFVQRLALSEVVLAVAAFHVCTWILAPRVTEPAMAWIFLGVLGLLCVYPAWISARIWRHLGAYARVRIPWPKWAAYRRDWRIHASLTLAAATVALLISVVSNPGWQDVDTARVLRGLLRYLGLAAVQVFFYFVFILPRLAVALGSTDPGDHRVWALMAVIFSLCHFPNPLLMLLGLPIAICWTWLYRHRPNPVLLCASHAVLGTLLAEVAQLHMRIGVAYSTPDFRPFRVALASVLNDALALH